MLVRPIPRRPLGFTLAAAVAFAATVQLAPPSTACPIIIRTLSGTIGESDAIVLAQVEAPGGNLSLHLLEILKSVRPEGMRNLPAPPEPGTTLSFGDGASVPDTIRDWEEADGKTALVFLNYVREAKSRPSLAVAGVRLLEDRVARDAYAARVRECVSIDAMPEGEERDRRALDWAVLCAEDPVTRADGALDLTYGSGPFGISPGGGFEALDQSQKDRLLAALRASTTFEDGEVDLAEFLAPSLDGWLLDRLVSELGRHAADPGYRANQLMHLIPQYADWRCGEFYANQLDFRAPLEARRATVDEYVAAFTAHESRADAAPCSTDEAEEVSDQPEEADEAEPAEEAELEALEAEGVEVEAEVDDLDDETDEEVPAQDEVEASPGA